MSKKILVVDDEEFVLKALSDKLQQSGFEVFEASDGEEGLDAAFKNHPDLILLDVVMPKMDGIEVMKKLRQDNWGKDVPLILLTRLEPDDNMLQEIIANKPTYYLVKSNYRIEDVVNKVKEKLGMPVEE
ncbi:MAG: response regulator [Candidatus Yanofskybacteria bacterium CG10_big_fil_rev_8_21_14_0_10_36_16]|uniref:Response regulator n=1 Tax=Candidatus Yanofskybacteria bacterium CG10_big_fil_rev_8_21_14_0_10_36_16 TaxID=1975096 RepID=A0A2J0Q9E0_9BACT|nr:MAG: response regulator [Candidatus Yanofskybacteria bacterium CG10_big_fil_rev_8_21_14_0_10_36_16]